MLTKTLQSGACLFWQLAFCILHPDVIPSPALTACILGFSSHFHSFRVFLPYMHRALYISPSFPRRHPAHKPPRAKPPRPNRAASHRFVEPNLASGYGRRPATVTKLVLTSTASDRGRDQPARHQTSSSREVHVKQGWQEKVVNGKQKRQRKRPIATLTTALPAHQDTATGYEKEKGSTHENPPFKRSLPPRCQLTNPTRPPSFCQNCASQLSRQGSDCATNDMHQIPPMTGDLEAPPFRQSCSFGEDSVWGTITSGAPPRIREDDDWVYRYRMRMVARIPGCARNENKNERRETERKYTSSLGLAIPFASLSTPRIRDRHRDDEIGDGEISAHIAFVVYRQILGSRRTEKEKEKVDIMKDVQVIEHVIGWRTQLHPPDTDVEESWRRTCHGPMTALHNRRSAPKPKSGEVAKSGEGKQREWRSSSGSDSGALSIQESTYTSFSSILVFVTQRREFGHSESQASRSTERRRRRPNHTRAPQN
ncbi:hypothetical protein K474DRAFT_1679018 [Panus rudis PR-1116 ss-1]|nr:hypothetical protein K474DRAFT_1679018 [Panus rudis PR-1116 ss-1]